MLIALRILAGVLVTLTGVGSVWGMAIITGAVCDLTDDDEDE